MTSPNPNLDFALPLPKPSHSSIENFKHRRTLSSISPSRNSSLQKVWAEDYFDSDNYEEEKAFEAASITPPPAATLTTRPFPRSILISAEEEACPARQTKTHQRSLTSLLPFRAPHTRTNSTSPQRSPTKEKSREEVEFMPTLTGDNDGTIRVADKSKGGIASWFTGSSAPVSVGIPVGEQESSSPDTMSSRDASPERPGAKLKRRPTFTTFDSSATMTNTTPTKTSSSTTSSTSRFNFFSSPRTPASHTIQLPQSSLQNDEFLTLDISSALSAGAQDPFSPSSFKNLLINAESLLLKLQTAYKLRTLSLHELSADKDALADELEEAETRAQCLRSQLEDMAAKSAEQDRTIADLVSQLAVEKHARAEEKEAREKSIALITSSRKELEKRASCCSQHEDLGINDLEGRRKWRNSGGTDLSTESDAESAPESVFSQLRSPSITTSSAASTMTSDTSPELLQASFARVVPVPQQQTPRPRPTERPSTFQKILRNMSISNEEREKDVVDNMFGAIGMGGSGCENCRGKDASVAWDAVGLLRAENRGLKDRVGDLEIAVDGALDCVSGLRL